MGRVKINPKFIENEMLKLEEPLEGLLQRIYETSQQMVPVSDAQREGPSITHEQEAKLNPRVVEHRRGSRNAKHKPGTLKKSGRWEVIEGIKGHLEGRVIYTARYAWFVEKGFGPGKRQPSHYLLNALEAHRDEIETGFNKKG